MNDPPFLFQATMSREGAPVVAESVTSSPEHTDEVLADAEK
jgi:hypothetical protein